MRLWPRPRDCEWEHEGASVLLPYGASPHQVEGALTAVGLYAPRGLDTLEWGVFPGAAATIFDASGEPIIHLLDQDPNR